MPMFRATARACGSSSWRASRRCGRWKLLAGRYPAATLAAAEALPALPAPVPSGIPSELLERRPDIIAAERRVAAAFDRVEEAKAARLPRINLLAALSSLLRHPLRADRNGDNPRGSAGLGLAAPLFTGGALEGQVEARTAEQKRAVAEYAAIGLKAFHEVESALANDAALRDRYAALEQLIADNERALKLSEVQYRIGKVICAQSSTNRCGSTARACSWSACRPSALRSA